MDEVSGIQEFEMDLHRDYIVILGLFSGLSNAKELRQRLVKGEINAALLKASLCSDALPVLIAANKAICQMKAKSMKTRNVHTEILYNLSPTNSINESLNKFGIADEDNIVLLTMVASKGSNYAKDLQNIIACIDGKSEPLDSLNTYANIQLLIKLYKISPEEMTVGSVTDAVVCRVAAKDAL